MHTKMKKKKVINRSKRRGDTKEQERNKVKWERKGKSKNMRQ